MHIIRSIILITLISLSIIIWYKLKKTNNGTKIKTNSCRICSKMTENKICNKCMTCFNINPDFDINLEHIVHEAKKINNFNNRSIDQFRKQFFQYDLVSLSNVLQKCQTGREFEIFVAQIFEYVGIK